MLPLACERACVRGHKPHDEIGTSVWTFCPRGGGLRNTAENARLGIGRAGLPPRTVPSVGLTSRARFAHTVCTLRDGRRETRHARKFARRGAGCTDAARGLENGRTGKRGMARSSLARVCTLCSCCCPPSAFCIHRGAEQTGRLCGCGGIGQVDQVMGGHLRLGSYSRPYASVDGIEVWHARACGHRA